MKIKCVKTSIDAPNKCIINGDMEGYLSINSIFWVYGMRFLRHVTYFYIFDDEHLVEIPLELFEVIDNTVPREWKLKIWSKEEITLWPNLFYEDGFLENFAEREKKERGMFEALRIAIEKQN